MKAVTRRDILIKKLYLLRQESSVLNATTKGTKLLLCYLNDPEITKVYSDTLLSLVKQQLQEVPSYDTPQRYDRQSGV